MKNENKKMFAIDAETNSELCNFDAEKMKELQKDDVLVFSDFKTAEKYLLRKTQDFANPETSWAYEALKYILKYWK